MHATVTAADYLAVELVANVRRRSLWCVLEIGSMQLVKVVYFPSTIAAMLISNQLLHGISTKATLSIKNLLLISLGLLGMNKLHKIGITVDREMFAVKKKNATRAGGENLMRENLSTSNN